MRTYILILSVILLIGFIDLVSATTIISINSGGNNKVVMTPSREIEGFFFNLFSKEPLPRGGGGFGRNPILDTIDPFLCHETHQYILEHPDQPDYSGIDDLVDKIEEETNQTVKFTLLRGYVDNWQFFCSDLINKTLEEDFVCEGVEKFLDENDKYTVIEINDLKNTFLDKILLSNRLVEFYIENFQGICKEKKVVDFRGFLILCFIIIILIITSYYNRKRLMTYSKLKSTKK